MADQYLTEDQLENIFRDVTVTISGLDDEKVRIAYQGQGQPGRDISQNLIYLFVTTFDDPYGQLREVVYKEKNDTHAEQEVRYTRVMQVDWTLYGPDAFDLADGLRHGILLEAHRSTLGSNKIYPIPRIPAPTKQPHQFNGQWWQRADLRAFFNVHTIRRSDQPYLVGADIEIHTEEGLQTVIEIREE